MVLRLELPRPIPRNSAMGIRVYLDSKRIYRVNSIDHSISKYSDSAKWIDKYTCELEGDFEVREVEEHKGIFDIYAK